MSTAVTNGEGDMEIRGLTLPHVRCDVQGASVRAAGMMNEGCKPGDRLALNKPTCTEQGGDIEAGRVLDQNVAFGTGTGH